MWRLFLFYWATRLRRYWWFPTIWTAIPVSIAIRAGARPPLILLAGSLGAALSLWPFFRQLLLFGWRTRGFRSHCVGQAVIHHAPGLETKVDVDAFARTWNEALLELTGRFGFPLRRGLVVYLFRTTGELSRIHRMVQGAGALPHGDAVVIAADYYAAQAVQAEIVRHELSHLFAAKLGQYDPPFKGEGLAVYVQTSIDGKAVDFHALAGVLGNSYLPFPWLLEPKIFFAMGRYSYAVAGSFTDFLVRNFGWTKYGRFYRKASRKNFVKRFERVFQTSLSEAERQWRKELLRQRGRFESELSSAVQEHRLEVAYGSWQFLYCIEQTESLLRSNKAKARTMMLASYAQMMLGNYREAIELMQRTLEMNDPELPIYRARCWLDVGRLHDLLGERDRALAAYERSLHEPDWWDPKTRSTHRLARRHLKRPFSERELLKPCRLD